MFYRYFMAAKPSIDRHLYTALLPASNVAAEYTQNAVALTDNTQPGYYEVSFSPGANYYVLSYKGPDVPWERLLEIGGDGESSEGICIANGRHRRVDGRQRGAE